MTTRFLYPFCGLLAVTFGATAAPVFSDNFNSYSSGNLVGQGSWQQTGATATSPIQVSSGAASLGPTGQDAYSPLPGGPLTIADGSSFYIGLNLNVSAAQTGDYFLHYTPTVGDSTLFFSRLFVQSSGSGYVLGWLGTSGTGATPTYGSTVLSLNTDYRLVLAYHAVAGTLNDTASIYLNPFTDPNVEGNNTAYLNVSWNSPNAENLTVASINLRQGGSSSGPTLTIDNLNASQSFGDVTSFTAVPEPSSIALGLLGLAGLMGIRKHKN